MVTTQRLKLGRVVATAMAGTIALLLGVVSGGRAQSTMRPWRSEPACRRLTYAMRSLPKLTPASNWPDRAKLHGVEFPVWTPSSAEARLDNIIRIRWLQGLRGAPASANWQAYRPRALEEIRAGKLSVEHTVINTGANAGILKLSRIKEYEDTDLSLSRMIIRSSSNTYFTFIDAASRFPTLHETPIITPLTGPLAGFTSPTVPLFIDHQLYFLSGTSLDNLSRLYIDQVTAAQVISGFHDICDLTYKEEGKK